jgi:hypothetical protein
MQLLREDGEQPVQLPESSSPAQHMNHQRIIHLRITRKANAICTEEAFVGMELFPEVGHALKCGNYMKKDGDLFKGTTP